MIWQSGERAANARIEKAASRSPSARTAVTPGSRPTASSLLTAGGLPTAGVSAVGRKLMADPPSLLGVRACRVDGPTGEDAMSRSAEINVLVCRVTRASALPFRVDETAYTERLTPVRATNGYNECSVGLAA